MKPTQITELLANIKNTFVSFFSILMFVALGVGIYLGISWTAPALQAAADKVFDEGSFHNVQILFSYGLTDDDLAQLAEIEGVSDIEAGRQSFQKATVGGENLMFKVQSMGERIDTLTALEGELPAKAGEIALNAHAAESYGIAVGDTITFEGDADDDTLSMDSLSDANAAPADNAQPDASGSAEPADASGGAEPADAPSDGAAPEASESAASADAARDGSNSADAPVAKDEGMKYLNDATYKVTALVNSPEYVALSKDTYGFSTSPSGEIDVLAWVLPVEFDGAEFQDGYPVVNVRCDSLQGMNSFSDEYTSKSEEIEGRITELGDSLAFARYDNLHEKLQAKIDDGEKKISEAEQKITETEQAIADGEKQLEDARVVFEQLRAEGESKLATGYQQLMYFEGQKADGERKLASAKAELGEAQAAMAEADAAKADLESALQGAKSFEAKQDATRDKKISDAKKDLDKGKITQDQYEAKVAKANADYDAALDSEGAKITKIAQSYASKLGKTVPAINHSNWDVALAAAGAVLDDFEKMPVTYKGKTMTVAEARKKIADGEAKVRKGESELASKSSQLNAAWAEYYAGQQELDQKTAEYEQKRADGQARIEEGRKQVEEGKKTVAENKPKLERAKERLAEMNQFAWTISGRAGNIAANEVDVFSGVTDNLSLSMALLFIIVGLLVSYSAVSRIVHEQVIQIGTKKALGLRNREITLSFLLYAGIAVLVGAIVGTIVGITVVEAIVGQAVGSMFVFGAFPPHFGLLSFIVVTLLELVLVLGATWLACRSILREHAVELLRGDKPPEAKTRFYEKWGIWEKLPLFTQTIVNNCVNDKRRVFSTIVGVAGCTALIVTAITLNNDVLKSYDRHYENVYGFNTIAYADPKVENALDGVEKVYADEGSDTAQVLARRLIMKEPDRDKTAVRIVVPTDTDAFERIYHVNAVEGSEFDPSAEGVWVTQAYKEHLGAKVGDEIELDAGDGVVHKVTILGFHEFWLTYHEMVMGRDYYESEFGKTLTPNVVLANTSVDAKDIAPKLEEVDGFDSTHNDKVDQYKNFETFSTVSGAVVLVYLVLATLMAIVVLLNLNVMFIEEKKRDLIVLMINGFSVKAAKRYIYQDTIVLTVIGIILGILLGCIMGSITVGSMEPSTAVFVKAVDLVAVLVGIIGSALLALIMSIIALRRIPKFDLTDINKS